MLRRLFRFAANVLLLSASSLFVAAFAALAFASFLLTWPLVHGSSKRRRINAAVNLMSAFMQFWSTLPSSVDAMESAIAMMQATRQGGGIHLQTVTEDDDGVEHVSNVE